MAYLIDGHNLIGQYPDLDFEDPDDEARLVERLKRLMHRKKKRCVVVFDHGLPGGPSRDLSSSNVKVVFAHGGTNADRIICERIRNTRDSKRWTVVSADHEVTDCAKRARMQIVTPDDFIRQIEALDIPDTPEERANIHLSAADVDQWLKVFGKGQD